MPFDTGLPGPPEAFSFFFVIIAIGAVTVFGMAVVKGLGQWRANNEAPLRSVDALVVSRRQDQNRHADHAATTSYHVTFEEPSGERRELQVSGTEFGQLAEGDRGHLIHQGTRYKGFTRARAIDGTH
jgi:uncharacterized protein YcfJ